MNRVASVHWGFSIGGVGKYASIIDRVNEFSDVEIHSVVVLSPSAHVDEDTMHSLANLEVIKLSSKFDISWLWKLRQSIKDKNVGLVLTHGFNGHFMMLVQTYLLGINKPLVCSYHGQYHATTPVRKVLGVVFNLLTEFYIRHCVKGAIAVADYCKVYLGTKRVNLSKIEVIHNGIENHKPNNEAKPILRDEWGISEDDILLGLASRLDPVKGIEFLLEAFINLHEKHESLKLVIIGTGTLEQQLKDKVASVGLEKFVIFTGFRSDINDCLAAMDVFVLPSLAEYHSIALLEAMRARKPIISTDVGGNTESVRDRQEALIVKPADVDELMSAISIMVEDTTLRDKLAQAASARFESNFTEEKTIKKTASWLRQFFH